MPNSLHQITCEIIALVQLADTKLHGSVLVCVIGIICILVTAAALFYASLKLPVAQVFCYYCLNLYVLADNSIPNSSHVLYKVYFLFLQPICALCHR